MDIYKDDMLMTAGVSAAAFLAPEELQKMSSSSPPEEQKNGSQAFIKKFGGGL